MIKHRCHIFQGRLLLGALALCCSLALPLSAAFGQSAAADKGIFVIDMERVVSESIIGKAAKNNIEAEAQKRQVSVDKGKAELDKLKGDLEKQSTLLSPEALSEKRDSFGKKEKELARMVQDQREELGKKNQAELSKVLKSVDEVVQDLAKQKQVKFILEKDRRFVLYSGPDLDLTEQVIKLLDSKTVS